MKVNKVMIHDGRLLKPLKLSARRQSYDQTTAE
jgi:hypothetical protein